MDKFKIFSSKSWMESNAISQMKSTSEMDGVLRVSGMPDMHVGKYGPNGCSVLSENLRPCLAGSDIGCGLGFWHLDTSFKIDKIESKLEDFDTFSILEDNMGTIGGGNHFLEIQKVEDVINEDVFKESGLDKKALYVLIHSGSRGIGGSILSDYIRENDSNPLTSDEDIAGYMKKHDDALLWAESNRKLCAEKTGSLLKADIHKIFDVPHNFIERSGNNFLHRKGSSASDRGLVMIPGSRGDYSVLVRPLESDDALFSIAHGAGRKITRTDAKYKINPQKNKMGNRVICGDRNLILEEDPSCYKSVKTVIQDLEDFGLIEVIAWFKPVVTYKTATKDNRKEKVKQRDIERKQARKDKWDRRF